MTTTDHQPEVQTETVSAVHPPFCEGGISCEKTEALPADWEHRGRVTTFYAHDQRVSLSLVRNDGQSVGRGYERGPVMLCLSLTEETFFDGDGNEVSVEVRFDGNAVKHLELFLEDYIRLQRRYDDPLSDAYDGPASELPKRAGMTKAQEVWNAIALGEELGRIKAREERKARKGKRQ